MFFPLDSISRTPLMNYVCDFRSFRSNCSTKGLMLCRALFMLPVEFLLSVFIIKVGDTWLHHVAELGGNCNDIHVLRILLDSMFFFRYRPSLQLLGQYAVSAQNVRRICCTQYFLRSALPVFVNRIVVFVQPIPPPPFPQHLVAFRQKIPRGIPHQSLIVWKAKIVPHPHLPLEAMDGQLHLQGVAMDEVSAEDQTINRRVHGMYPPAGDEECLALAKDNLADFPSRREDEVGEECRFLPSLTSSRIGCPFGEYFEVLRCRFDEKEGFATVI
mmetsp:Transcript_37074/g.89408  ORF Transcript_37074/g.89408 Transcript_37074/m.89408 type:complete len:272 (-) Transcript_37074:223-1038(-)